MQRPQRRVELLRARRELVWIACGALVRSEHRAPADLVDIDLRERLAHRDQQPPLIDLRQEDVLHRHAARREPRGNEGKEPSAR